VVLSAGSLGGAGSITLSAPFTLSGGAVTGTLTTSGATQISGSPQLAGGSWSNSGVVGIQGSGALVFTNGGHFTNLAAGTVNLNSSAAEPITYGGGAAGTFDNLGLLTQNAAGAHSMNANVTFNQSATVHVTAGSFVPNNGTDSGATYTLDAGTHVDYTSGTRTLSGSNTHNGAGSARLAGANWALSGAVSLGGTSTLELQSGAIGGGTLATSLAVQVSGSPVLNGTQWTNSATLDLTGAGTLVFTSGALLTNAAAATLTLGSSAATVFVYGGGAAGQVVNQGLFVQQAAGTHALDANITLVNTGTLQLAAGTLAAPGMSGNAGTLSLAAGATLQVDNGLINTGSVEGNGSIATGSAAFQNQGLLSPGSAANAVGTLTVNGNFTNGAGGTLAMQAAGNSAGSYDSLAVTGNANLGGTLTLSEINGHVSDFSSVYTLVTAGTRSGSFGSTSLPADINWLISASGDLVLSVQSLTTRWSSSSTGDWGLASNWSRGLPGPNTDVVINALGGPPVVHVTSGTQSAHSLTTDVPLSVEGGSLAIVSTASLGGGVTLSGGTLDLGGASSLSSLNLSGGTLTGAGAVTVGGQFVWSGGSLAGSGSFTTQAASSLSGGNKTLDTRSWNNAAGGNISWSGGDLAFANGARLVNAGSLAVSNGAHSATGGRLDNTGTLTIGAASSLNVPTLNLQGGSIDGQGALTVSSDFNATGGSMAGTLSDLDLTRPDNFVAGNLAATNSLRLVAGGALSQAAATSLNAPVVTLVAVGDIGASSAPMQVAATSGVAAQASSGSVYLQAPGAMPLRLASAAGTVNLQAGGAISDANGSAGNIAGSSAHISAGNGIGSGDALETQLAHLSTQNANATTRISNTGALDVQGMTNQGSGDIVLDNIGAITTSGAVLATGGQVVMTAHSPIVVGSPGISASGGIFLTALGSNVTDSITLNGPLSSSGGNISLVAGSSIQQN
ncbi:MAG: hypothetical protein JNJ60_18065, partial [Rhodocyclaceae bacterium]|nr:hypothetical protein [Rhodocyclaceae bacterium]